MKKDVKKGKKERDKKRKQPNQCCSLDSVILSVDQNVYDRDSLLGTFLRRIHLLSHPRTSFSLLFLYLLSLLRIDITCLLVSSFLTKQESLSLAVRVSLLQFVYFTWSSHLISFCSKLLVSFKFLVISLETTCSVSEQISSC